MIRLHALGACSIQIGARRLGPDAERAFAVLLVLLLAGGRPVSRRWLLELLWPGIPEAHRQHNLRQTFYKLRLLGVELVSDRQTVRLCASHVELDAGCAEGDDAEGGEELLDPDRPFGEFLAGYAPDFSPAFAAWLDEQRDLVHARVRRTLLRLLLDQRRRGEWHEVERLARRVLVVDPLNEEATLALAESTAMNGSKTAALGILDAFVAELGDAVADIRLPALVLRRRIAERLQPPPSLAAGEACYVGRAETTALLHGQLQATRRGSGRACLLWGEAGMGKSRAVLEFGRLAALEGARLQRVACQPRDVGRPLSVFVDVVPSLLALPGALGCSPTSLAHLKRLTEHDPDAEPLALETRDAELLFAGVRQAIFDLLDAVAEEGCVVLAVEDVHWLDQMSWQILAELVGWIGTRRLQLLLTSRLPHPLPKTPPSLPPGLVVHRLPPLDDAAAVTLLAAVLGGGEAAMPSAFRDWCIHLAEGNPFFLRALAVHWLETGEVGVPTSLRVLIDERVNRVDAAALRTLQACAVLGRNATLERLERVLEQRRFELIESISALESHGLLAADGAHVPPKHELVAQAALERLSEAARRMLHRVVAAALQRDLEADPSSGLLWDCTRHWQLAGEPEYALSLVRSCAQHLCELGLPEDAADALEQARQLAPDAADLDALLRDMEQCLRLAGRWQKAVDVITELTILNRRHNPLFEEHSDLELRLLEARWRTDADLPTLLATVERCVNDANGGVQHRIRAASIGLVFADNLGEHAAAHRIYEASRGLVEAERQDERAVLHCEIVYHSVYGDLDRAIAAGRGLIDLERRSGEPVQLARALRHASVPIWYRGHFDEAITLLVEAYQLACRYRLTSAAMSACDSLATLNLHLAQLETAKDWYKRAMEWTQSTEDAMVHQSIARLGLRIGIATGQPDRHIEPAKLDFNDRIARRRIEAFALCGLMPEFAMTADQLDRFRDEFLTLRGVGRQDLSLAGLVTALMRSGRSEEARILASDYMTLRRERCILGFELREALASLHSVDAKHAVG